MSNDKKLLYRWRGPYRVLEAASAGRYKIAEMDGTEMHGVYPAQRLRVFVEDRDGYWEPASDDHDVWLDGALTDLPDKDAFVGVTEMDDADDLGEDIAMDPGIGEVMDRLRRRLAEKTDRRDKVTEVNSIAFEGFGEDYPFYELSLDYTVM
ncbi:hypothetical protein F4861DRAFT_544530 [Xylaria intraflava]|nr:hypothetical protein F4861DRAFT_544530 [Xylaria intraflava]